LGREVNIVIEFSKVYNETMSTFKFLNELSVEFVSNYPNKRLGNELNETRLTIFELMSENSKVSMAKLAIVLEISTTANIKFLKENGYI